MPCGHIVGCCRVLEGAGGTGKALGSGGRGAALGTAPVRKFGTAAFGAHENALFLERQMGPPPADFAFGMMFYRYASHGFVRSVRVGLGPRRDPYSHPDYGNF